MQRALKVASRESKENKKARTQILRKTNSSLSSSRREPNSQVLIQRQRSRSLEPQHRSVSSLPRTKVLIHRPQSEAVKRTPHRKVVATRSFKIKNIAELWFAGFLFLVLLGKLYVRVSIIESSYQIENVRNELLMEDAKLRELRVKKAMVISPKELSALAYNKLGMRPTLPQQIRRVQVD